LIPDNSTAAAAGTAYIVKAIAAATKISTVIPKTIAVTIRIRVSGALRTG
jgi:hypothetical protein